jgi:hypothetical protein
MPNQSSPISINWPETLSDGVSLPNYTPLLSRLPDRGTDQDSGDWQIMLTSSGIQWSLSRGTAEESTRFYKLGGDLIPESSEDAKLNSFYRFMSVVLIYHLNKKSLVEATDVLSEIYRWQIEENKTSVIDEPQMKSFSTSPLRRL